MNFLTSFDIVCSEWSHYLRVSECWEIGKMSTLCSVKRHSVCVCVSCILGKRRLH